MRSLVSMMRQTTPARGLICRVAGIGLAAGLVGACATTADDVGSRLLVAPGGFDLYNCQQLTNTIAGLKSRKKELEGLMAKAETDAGGKLMSAMGYKPDYMSTLGQLRSAEATAREKQCAAPPAPAAPAAAKKPAARKR